jgi:predicted transglutaminase-like cysteine proteinase
VRCWAVATRWLAGAAIGAALVLSFAPPRLSLAAPPSGLIASLAPDQNPVDASITRLPKWQRIRDWLAAGHVTDPALSEWTSFAMSLRGMPEMQRLTAINLRVNKSFRYASDIEVWGVADYWETPAEIVAKRATDCEGFAIFKYWLARMAGVPDDELTMMVGIIASTHQMHAALVAGVAQRGYVLDVRTPYVVDAATFGDFRLLVTVDLNVIEIFVKGFGGQPAPAALSAN